MSEDNPTYDYESIKRYRATDKGRAAKRKADAKYDQSEAGRARAARYRDSPEQRERKRAYARERYQKLKAQRKDAASE
jgi:hypothetical protein